MRAGHVCLARRRPVSAHSGQSRRQTALTQPLTQQFTWLIASGQLRPGDMLPSVRQLAGRLSISVNTVRSAYQKLEANGLVEARHGIGTRVLAHDAVLLAAIAAAERSHTVGVILLSLTDPLDKRPPGTAISPLQEAPLISPVDFIAGRARGAATRCAKTSKVWSRPETVRGDV